MSAVLQTPEEKAALAAFYLADSLSLRDYPWYVATGYTAGAENIEIIVYATDPSKAKKVVPSVFQGVPVIIKKMGRPRPA